MARYVKACVAKPANMVEGETDSYCFLISTCVLLCAHHTQNVERKCDIYMVLFNQENVCSSCLLDPAPHHG